MFRVVLVCLVFTFGSHFPPQTSVSSPRPAGPLFRRTARRERAPNKALLIRRYWRSSCSRLLLHLVDISLLLFFLPSFPTLEVSKQTFAFNATRHRRGASIILAELLAEISREKKGVPELSEAKTSGEI